MLTNFAANTVCNKPGQRVCSRTSALTGRFFVFACLFSCSLLYAAGAAPTGDDLEKYRQDDSCKISGPGKTVGIKHVIDGDTVILDNDERVRLIGINAPELGRDGHPSQAGADQARYYLTDLLKTQRELVLLPDAEQKDRYQRTLAHLFLKDGTNLQALMLNRGLVTPLVIPPNVAYLDCYEISGRFAQQHQIGLWALKQYQPQSAETLNYNDLGYRIITGTVLRVGESRSALWINLAPHVALRIVQDDIRYFKPEYFRSISGKQLTARGILYYLNGQLRMQIRHPADISLNNNNNQGRN